MSLLLEAFDRLPQPRPLDDSELWQAGVEEAAREFRDLVLERYTEGTLQRILQSSEDDRARRAAAFALGISGQFSSGRILAEAIKNDPDELVRKFSIDAIWEVWFRGESPEQAQSLRMALTLTETTARYQALTQIIAHHPTFAEAYNQRAILLFRKNDFLAAIRDCEQTLQLNPAHFGAASGMGQCYLRLARPRAALRAFVLALEINPSLTDLTETIRSLQAQFGETDMS